MIFWPSTSTSPPVWPLPAPETSSVPATRVMPSLPPSTTIWPLRLFKLRARTTPSRFSTVSAKPARAAARNSALPPSANTLPSTDRRASRRSFRALKKTSPSPSTSTSTSVAAAKPTRRACTRPLCSNRGATSSTLPSLAVMLPSARNSALLPESALALAAVPSCKRPLAASCCPSASVVATRPPTSTCEVAPKYTPRGLTNQTCPLLLSAP